MSGKTNALQHFFFIAKNIQLQLKTRSAIVKSTIFTISGICLPVSNTKTVNGFWTISDIVVLVKLHGKYLDIHIIQAYAPTKIVLKMI